LIILVWGVTGTTIVTFLMVFLIQNTQNRDSHAVQLKLDELIRAVNGAHNALLDPTSSGFACAMKHSRALHAKRCVAGNWIPARRK
jgi:hypothetical protein